MSNMFWKSSAFNQDISQWDVSIVTDMTSMFQGADAFNQDISSWDVSNTAEMSRMFKSTDAFNQDLASWDISSVETLEGMLDNADLSVANYDATLAGWVALSTVPTDIEFGAKAQQYCNDTSHHFLTNEKGWGITGDSQANNCAG